MKYAPAFIIVLTCLIPVLVGLGFGWNALLTYCTSNDGCKNDEICSDNQCVYACKGRGCPNGAMCVASSHTFACKCPSGFGVSPNDTMNVCRALCNQDEDCRLSEKCELGICIDACANYVCNGMHTTSLAYKRKCTCECLPKFRPNLKGDCVRIPVCSQHQDCHYSERCSSRRCVGVCLGHTCPPNQGCIAYNHTLVCGELSQPNVELDTEVASIPVLQATISAPISQEILLNILAYSTSAETKIALSRSLHRRVDDFKWPADAESPNFKRVKNLHKSSNITAVDWHDLYMGVVGELDIKRVVAEFGIAIITDADPPSVKFSLIQVVNFIIEPKNLETSCYEVDESAGTLSLAGTFHTGQLIGTNYRFVAIPYKKLPGVDSDIRIVFLYSETPRYRLSTATVRKLSQLQPHVFFSETNDKSSMIVIIPNDLEIESHIDVGKNVFQYELNMKKVVFGNSGEAVTFQPGEYAIYQNISMEIAAENGGECSLLPDINVLLDQTDFAIFIVSKEYTFFRAFNPLS